MKYFAFLQKVQFNRVLCILKGYYDESYITITCVVMWMFYLDRCKNILLQNCSYSTQDLEFQYIKYETFCNKECTRTWTYKSWINIVIIQYYSNTEMHHKIIKPKLHWFLNQFDDFSSEMIIKNTSKMLLISIIICF